MMENPYASGSSEQLAEVLDNAPAAVVVSLVETRELVYANTLAWELFLPGGHSPGKTCYQAAGFDRPCPFCQAEKLTRSDFLVRRFSSPDNSRIYQLSGKLIDWDGRPAHIEYIVDITQAQRKEERARSYSQDLQQTFQNIPCGLCVYRYDGERIAPVYHNPGFFEIMGYTPEEIRSVEQETRFLGVCPEDIGPFRAAVREALSRGDTLRHDFRIWNSRKKQTGFVHLEGAVKPQKDGSKLLFCVFSDTSQQRLLEIELTGEKEKMRDIVNAIPGGIAIYKMSDIFETIYFSDGVAALTGYSLEEYRGFSRRDAAQRIYPEDAGMVVEKVRRAVRDHAVADFEFRKRHRDGHIVWVHMQAKQIGTMDGCPLLHCVFHNISALKQTQLEMDHLVNSIPGGIASYRIEGGRFIPVYFSDGLLSLSGHTRGEYSELIRDDAFCLVYEADRSRVASALQTAVASGQVLDMSYRTRHKNGRLVWVHINGRRMGPLSDSMRFYAVFTGMSSEAQLFQNIANETADEIYVIDKNTYELLYINESKNLFLNEADCIGQKCYAALHGCDKPCAFCTLKSHPPDGRAHAMNCEGTGRFYSTRFRETDWNGIPAYIKYVQDVTEEVRVQREKERLEQYFQTLVRKLPSGVAVVRYEKDGSMLPEYFSEGFAALTGMTMDEVWQIYGKDAMAGVHPDDFDRLGEAVADFLCGNQESCELVYRLRKGSGSYVWVKNSVSMIERENGGFTLYASYHDMTRDLEEQERFRQQYKELILQHYRTPGPNALIVGHCNVTRDRILEISDHTASGLLEAFGSERDAFFTSLAGLVVDEKERRDFLDLFLNEPTLAAFAAGRTEQELNCFVKLPREDSGRYVKFKVGLVETPDTGDLTGILTVFDITEQTISDRNLHRLSSSSYDLIADLNLLRDSYTILSGGIAADNLPKSGGCYSKRVAYMLEKQVVPKDKSLVAKMMDPEYLYKRLGREGAYSFSFSILSAKGDILTKKLTLSATDLRLGRVCLARADITDSVREQQGLLNVVAYTFELLGFIRVRSRRFTLYTRQTVLQALPPLQVEDYAEWFHSVQEHYVPDGGPEEVERRFSLQNMLERLEERPGGYDFVFPYQSEEGLRYKQANVLWGDRDHKTVCIVRADVTDMLTAERKSKEALEKALALAEEASRAKSDFLSSMSHDIRTPMNAIIGMTTLAEAHLDDRERVGECLRKISLSSRHLLSLINDILDMSKIERSKITLNHGKASLFELVDQLSSMMGPQAKEAGQRFKVQFGEIAHPYFYGDSLRINQILINLLSNAIKFTPEGGVVGFLTEEIPPVREGAVRYRFTVSDTGLGMPENFLTHLFEPFTRSKSTARIEGTGLGLSITKGLVDLMGGEISVESVEHGGSTFRVELECDVARQDRRDSTGAPGAQTAAGIDGRFFLVAEDNEINAEILCELLQLHHAGAVVKPDGAQAVSEFQNAAPGTYDAILMDIQMPEMNGYEATRAIRKLKRADAESIPIVAMTANAFAEDIQAALDAGMTAHVAKPVDMPVLIETLNKLMR